MGPLLIGSALAGPWRSWREDLVPRLRMAIVSLVLPWRAVVVHVSEAHMPVDISIDRVFAADMKVKLLLAHASSLTPLI